jgi:hypothetical protein
MENFYKNDFSDIIENEEIEKVENYQNETLNQKSVAIKEKNQANNDEKNYLLDLEDLYQKHKDAIIFLMKANIQNDEIKSLFIEELKKLLMVPEIFLVLLYILSEDTKEKNKLIFKYVLSDPSRIKYFFLLKRIILREVNVKVKSADNKITDFVFNDKAFKEFLDEVLSKKELNEKLRKDFLKLRVVLEDDSYHMCSIDDLNCKLYYLNSSVREILNLIKKTNPSDKENALTKIDELKSLLTSLQNTIQSKSSGIKDTIQIESEGIKNSINGIVLKFDEIKEFLNSVKEEITLSLTNKTNQEISIDTSIIEEKLNEILNLIQNQQGEKDENLITQLGEQIGVMNEMIEKLFKSVNELNEKVSFLTEKMQEIDTERLNSFISKEEEVLAEVENLIKNKKGAEDE